jgi:hypothetical protein
VSADLCFADARQRRWPSRPAVQEAAMYLRILLITLLGSLIAACAPYAGGGAYYQQTQVYTADPYPYGYSGFN